MIEIPGTRINGDGEAFYLLVFRNRVRSLKGEPLDRDYTITFGFCTGCGFGDDILRASLPSDGQFKSDPMAPLSIYFNGPIDPASFLAELRYGVGGPIVTPFAFHWDMPAPPPYDKGFMHLTVDHPPLPMSYTPYVFQSLQIFGPATTQYSAYRLFDFRISFAVTPALPGDVNDDGVVDISDATLALQGALGLVSLTAAQRFAADVAPSSGGAGHPVGEGSVGVDDVERILQRVVGLIPDDQWP